MAALRRANDESARQLEHSELPDEFDRRADDDVPKDEHLATLLDLRPNRASDNTSACEGEPFATARHSLEVILAMLQQSDTMLKSAAHHAASAKRCADMIEPAKASDRDLARRDFLQALRHAAKSSAKPSRVRKKSSDIMLKAAAHHASSAERCAHMIEIAKASDRDLARRDLSQALRHAAKSSAKPIVRKKPSPLLFPL